MSQIYTSVSSVKDALEIAYSPEEVGKDVFLMFVCVHAYASAHVCQWLPHHALVFFVPHLNPLLPLVLVEFVLVQNSGDRRHPSVRSHAEKHVSYKHTG